MFPLGHLGIGWKIASPILKRKSLPLFFFFLGTLFPDLLDKSLYYGLSFLTGKEGLELGLISGTRTFGHTIILCLAMSWIAWVKESPKIWALVLGVLTHLFLDHLGDQIQIWFDPNFQNEGMRFQALFWPLLGFQFPHTPFEGLKEHLGSGWFRPVLLFSEFLGLFFLLRLWIKRSQ